MTILTTVLNALVVMICLFLICLILIQRGKGGGLAGAFGGVGGSSAFGTKAGDVFTRVTMIVAGVWIVFAMLLVKLYNRPTESAFDDGTSTSVSREITRKIDPSKGVTLPPPPVPASPSAPAVGTNPNPASAAPTSVPAIPDAPAAPKPK